MGHGRKAKAATGSVMLGRLSPRPAEAPEQIVVYQPARSHARHSWQREFFSSVRVPPIQ